MTRRYFIDTNVFMRTAQCHIADLKYFCEKSRSFLEEHRGECAVGYGVIEEVDDQLRYNKDDYRGAKDVRHRVRACDVLPEENEIDIIGRLIMEYGRNGWGGGTSENDKMHAAVASAFGVPHMVTWDRDFRLRQGWVNEINAEVSVTRLVFVQPDEA